MTDGAGPPRQFADELYVDGALTWEAIAKFDKSQESLLKPGDAAPDGKVAPLDEMVALFEKWKSRVDFCAVYVQEAHPTDEWHMYTDVCFRQPKSLSERMALARKYVTETNFPMPLVVDSMNDILLDEYFAWPERLYVIGGDGKIMYVGGKGPDDYKPSALEEFLRKTLGN